MTRPLRGDILEPWTPRTLYIHHISTGRGNAAFIVCPDGTTVLVDASAQNSSPGWQSDEMYRIAAKPDASRRPGEWLARYIKRHMPAGRNPQIDYFILTHLHSDHMGGVNETPGATAARSRIGDYELTGVMDVHEQVPIRFILDRGYPDYNYPAPLLGPHQRNYRAFIHSFVEWAGGWSDLSLVGTIK